MDNQRRDEFRKILQSQMETLLEEAGKTVNGMTADKETFPDPTDRALLESNRNFQLRIRERERKLLKKIQEALSRLDDGSFGVCEECGEDIGAERLRARPVTTLCIACKTRLEEIERRNGT
ncbi:MAG: RNA polymerase-binding protein DksA [Deltaproteobacteria bacterium RBG_13_65_10]|jgi:DnaK suppressor protein|nr:MAG: RNA polymerase-binding protein DksA [Deltaproteobacteria bacterium RBG_13_65_10]